MNEPISQAIASFTADVNVGMNEVVSVFVSRYEDKLFEKKGELSERINQLKLQQTKLDKDVRQSVDLSVYHQDVPAMGMAFQAEVGTINWNQTNANILHNVRVSVKLVDVTNNDSHVWSRYVYLPISEEHISEWKKVSEETAKLNEELAGVLIEIKSVGRKERQIRGRISEMKLAECGYTDLLTNPDLVKLISVE